MLQVLMVSMAMSFEEYLKEKLWPILVETVHTLPMYPHHKAYVREVVLQEKPEMSPPDVALRMKISLGEALVILYELLEEKEAKS
jgi:hypothetical protein